MATQKEDRVHAKGQAAASLHSKIAIAQQRKCEIEADIASAQTPEHLEAQASTAMNEIVNERVATKEAEAIALDA